MKCPACQTENAPGAAFCAQCSTPLPAEPAAGQGWQQPGQQQPGQYPSGEQYPPPGGPGQPAPGQHLQEAPGQYPSGDQYPPGQPGQYPSGQYSPGGQGQPGPYPSGEQYPPPGGPGQPTAPGHYPSGQYPPGGQGQPGPYPSGEQYPPPGGPGQPTAPGHYPSGQYPPGGQGQPGPYPSGEQYPPPGGPGQPTAPGQYPPGQFPSGEQAPGAGWQGAPPPGYPPGYGGPPAGGSGKGSGRILLVVVALVAVAAIVASAIVFLGGGEEDSDEVVLEPIGSVQEDDFAGNLDTEQLGEGVSMALGGLPDVAEDTTATLSGARTDGDAPGLYGGSRDAAVCDVQALVDFLTDGANADKAEAWAEVHGIEASGIADFIAGLTPVRLRMDTRVTNHGFSGGDATPFQSLLQAGTAVMVDAQGVPRVKCNCGNPLLEPQSADSAEGDPMDMQEVAQNPEDAWDGLDPADVVSIQPAASEVESFTMVAMSDGSMFDRPVGSNGEADAEPSNVSEACEALGESPSCGGSGEEELQLGGGSMQVTLRWDSNADLDLHVTEPDGNEIFYGNSGPSTTGGQLDKDSNVGCNLNGAVENVFWPEGQAAPAGTYTVEVTGYSVGDAECGPGDYELTIRVDGQDDRVETGSVADGETDPYTVTIG